MLNCQCKNTLRQSASDLDLRASDSASATDYVLVINVIIELLKKSIDMSFNIGN